jgi:hypothetical protein
MIAGATAQFAVVAKTAHPVVIVLVGTVVGT